MVAPRSLPEPVGPPPAGPGRPAAGEIAALARAWARAVPEAAPQTARALASVLRGLATACRAEPFWPLAARPLGARVLDSGLCGDPSRPGAEDVLPVSLGLLRESGAAVLGLAGPAGEHRLAAALDELATGFAGALRERAAAAGPSVESHYRAVYTQGPVGIGIAGLSGLVLDMNPALQRMFGLTAALDEPRPVVDFVHPDDVDEVIARFGRLLRGSADVLRADVRFVRPDGLVVWTHLVASLVRDERGVPTHCIAVVEDVSERYRLRTRLEQASYQDRLTRLPNRSLTGQWLERAVGPDGARRVGICALDVDDFTAVNDGLGHRAGDQLLLAISGRLQLAAGEHLVTRIGGDEFAVLVSDPEGLDELGRLADRLLAALAAPFLVCGHSLAVTASVGVAEAAAGTVCPEELMRAVTVARSWAKAHGGGRWVAFDPERDAGESARFALLAGLRAAVDRDELRLAFQPLVHLTTGRVHAAEALVRWAHPTEGLIGPGRFIELAERSGAIVPLGRWVLQAACAQAAGWYRDLGAGAPYVSVNVSPVQLVEPGWVPEVTRVLAATGLPPDRLQLEITEQAVLGDETAALEALTALRAAGVRLALDDFGTGYSSLAWLRRLPVHALKIDGSFIDGLRHPDADPVDSSIVAALVGMAHALGLEVTAEWVETGVQAGRLAELGCDLGQGRWFGDAGPGEWVPRLWRRSIQP